MRQSGTLREAADRLLGCIVEGPDGELALVPDSKAEVEALRAAVLEETSEDQRG